jgi:hypothetical protein
MTYPTAKNTLINPHSLQFLSDLMFRLSTHRMTHLMAPHTHVATALSTSRIIVLLASFMLMNCIEMLLVIIYRFSMIGRQKRVSPIVALHD